ncbi:hypothetical protein [Snuella lapsa]|uniref:Novel STAND NTPase 3 domain-containing protein n=1 Tax=Snuella lapsa TaxID=870481 RepID=A0ABP6WPH7_9FLAO
MSNNSSNIGPRDYKISEIKRLFAESNNQCAKPNCHRSLIAEDNITVIGKICHIEAANKNGPRFNEDMNNDQRRSYDNLILLCDEHHRMIDNPQNESKYKKEKLLEWKQNHISENRSSLYKISIDDIQKFIEETKKYYQKIDSLDGPYQPRVSLEYVERGIESELTQVLKENKVLLLTGVSFCGKSQTAFNIANDFYKDGYLFKRVLNTRDAASFLESTGTNRICVLEDPFGHAFGTEKKAELKLVKDMLEALSPNNLLIITSKKEIILSINNQTKLEDCNIKGHKWFDLTSTDKSFLLDVWKGLTLNSEILSENITQVETLIINENEIQAGQLAYLSKKKELQFKIMQAQELYQLAQIDIDDICNDILNNRDYSWKILSILGLGANTRDGLTLQDFDYILQSNKCTLSLEKPDRGTTLNPLEMDAAFILPSYKTAYNNISQIESTLEYLEQSGFIEFENEQFVFRHPHYQEIGKNILKKLSRLKRKDLIVCISNLLTCLNQESAFICANNLKVIFKYFQEHQEIIIENAYQVSERSFFPKVSDNCVLFLLNVYDETLMETYRSKMVFRLQSKSEEYGILFQNQKPYRYSSAGFFEGLDLLSVEQYEASIESIMRDESLSLKNIWGGLLTINNSSLKPNVEFLEYAFKSNEVFVRNLCAYIYFLNLKELYDSYLKDKILTDEHPSVIFFALKGYFQGLHQNGLSINKEISKRFEHFFKSDKIFCIRASTLMTNFNTDYANDSINWEKIPRDKHVWLWRIWAKYFVQFLKVFPKDVTYFHNARFSGTMNKAKDMVYPRQGQMISKYMLKRLKEISKTRILNHFEMHLIEFFIISTSEEPELRKKLFKNFFDSKLPTYFVGYNLVWTFGVWDSLTHSEKEIIGETINDGSRVDRIWLQAMILNNQFLPPPQLIEVIFGNSEFLSQDVSIIINQIDKDLLNKVITVYLGKEDVFEELGVSKTSDKVRDIVYYIAANHLPIKYEDCLSSFLLHFINGIRREEHEMYKNIWKKTYTVAENKFKLLDTVIRNVGKSSFCFNETTFLFEVIIKYHLEKNEAEKLAKILADNFEYLCYSSTDKDLFRVLDFQEFLKTNLIPEMKNQFEIFGLLLSLKEREFVPNEQEQIVEKITNITNQEDVKLLSIFRLINDLEQSNTLEDELLRKLQQIPDNIREKQKEYFHIKANTQKLDGFINNYNVLSVKL